MAVVGRADGHGVDALLHFVEHFAEIVELLGLGEGDRAALRLFSSTSQIATMSPARPASRESLKPLPLRPMLAMAIRSLGERLSLATAPAASQIADARGGGGLQKLAASRHKWCSFQRQDEGAFSGGNSA